MQLLGEEEGVIQVRLTGLVRLLRDSQLRFRRWMVGTVRASHAAGQVTKATVDGLERAVTAHEVVYYVEDATFSYDGTKW
jgi:hypothetical protein